MQKSQSLEPILVKNPYTNQHINVAPLFEYLHKQSSPTPPSIDQISNVLETAIRFIAIDCRFENADPNDISNTFYQLYTLRDAFAKVKEC
ncbi:hypothetical protein BWI96_16720 [Siphonobacter sp. SORGH_AS_0500]|uniref:hypothetical protein n=1 Tax=Siphonobacter sp. SORGH_AS_0500 TaxID=1864824 RepID=UPI000CC2A14F|nr:hypothetical protein [Siphonobacter sp. SORGH_AS_0500]PKK35542.1 hypothetical protein BWI96_16720 [Siphonobacter sp. SORGH_AS_0500]